MAENVNTPRGSNVANTTQNNPSEGSRVESKTATTATSEETPTMADLKGIRYTGGSDSRSITKSDFAGVKVEAKGDLKWDASNDFTVDAAELSAAVRDYLLADGEFEAVTK